MKIIYGYSNCTDSKYYELVASKGSTSMLPDQKYHGLLIRGLAKNCQSVECLSGLPINRSVTKKLFINEKDELEGNARFHYYKTFNLPILRQIMIFVGGLVSALKVKKEKGQTYAICDALNIANVYGIKLACKLKRIPLVLVVTDLPDMLKGGRIKKFIGNRVLKKADAFILLTEQMNEKVNSKKKPYIVLEGHSDADLQVLDDNEKFEVKEGKKVVLYAGSTVREYGIFNLIEGVKKANVDDIELRIFGTGGGVEEELKEISLASPKIKYMGVLPNADIVNMEMQSSLLVNPRPSGQEFTKYSFPSKNMEYMISGTPLLTTKLPGMPTEYYEHVYLLEDESPNGIAKKIEEIFSLSFKERNQKGKGAREFVRENKSNVVQGAKITEFLRSNF